jgi:hypothetical protein
MTGDNVVPRVVLEATHERSLDSVSLEDLRLFAADSPPSSPETAPDNSGQSGSTGRLRFDVGR